MRPRRRAVGALVAALALGPALIVTGASQAAATTRIMLAGDSITQGIDGDYTWRYRLAMELRRQGATAVDLVGPKRWPTGGEHHYLARGWDTDHDGTTGTKLHEQVARIGGEVAQYRPTLLVSYLGTNDLLDVERTHPRLAPAQLRPLYASRVQRMITDWKAYVAAVRAAEPAIRIVLGEVVTPRVPAAIRADYNARLLAEVRQPLSTPDSPIEVAQLAGTVWQSSRYLYDRTHPTPTGDTLLAQRFAESIRLLEPDLLPRVPRIQRAYVPWDPPIRWRTKIHGTRIKLDWTFTARYNQIRKMRVEVRPARGGGARVTPLLARTSWTSAQLKPGTYRIRLQGTRALMSSTWSRTVTVRVRG